MTPADTTSPQKVSPFKVFRNRSFTLMWTGQLVETMGVALTSLASAILVFRMTNSAMNVGFMLMASVAPSLLIGLFAGVLVDRYDRKKIMIVTNLVRTVLVLIIPFIIQYNVIWLYVIVLLSSAVTQFFDPAHESVLPEVAAEEDLAAANSLMAISAFGSTAIGFAATGLIASAGDISWAFYANAIAYLFSTICIALIPIAPLQVDQDAEGSRIFQNLKLGMHHLFETPILRSVFSYQILVAISVGITNTLLLPFAMGPLNATEFQYGIQEGLTSVGFVVASLLVAGIFDRVREGTWITASLVGMALSTIAYSLTRSITLAILIVTISGFFNAPLSIGRRLIIQRNTPREMRGRVNSAFFVFGDLLYLAGMALAGLADIINIRILFFASGVLMLFGGLLVMVLPGLRQNRAEWKRALALLKSAPATPTLGIGRSAVLDDFYALSKRLPSFATLSPKQQQDFIKDARVYEVASGETILRHGETGDAAYFILDGKTVAGAVAEDGTYRSLSKMTAGDFFGEIAALTGVSRTADVVTTEPTSLIEIPAEALRSLMSSPEISNIFLSKMTERLSRTNLNDLPRFSSIDQRDAQDLRAVLATE
jgi:MFS transporter, DHA3 family, macrolide efflux protein